MRNVYVVTCEMAAFPDREGPCEHSSSTLLGAFGSKARAETFISGITEIKVPFPTDETIKVRTLGRFQKLRDRRTCVGEDDKHRLRWEFSLLIEQLKVE